MKKKFLVGVLIVVTALIAPLACEGPAEFQVVSVDITPPEVTAGEAVTVTAEVKHIGGSEGIYSATLTVDGAEVETKDATVAPGGTETVSFSLVKDEAGTYQVAVGDLSSSLTVKEEEIESKIIIDGVIDEWPPDATMVLDPCGDVSDQAKNKRGADLKMVLALMDEDYLYVALQLCDAFEPSLLRNYFVDLDLDKDRLPDYDFGVRPYDFLVRAAGQAWVLVSGLTGNKSDWFNENNWERKEAYQVVAVGKLDTGVLEVAIPREVYQIPDSVLARVRVTEGGPDVDYTKVFEVTLE